MFCHIFSFIAEQLSQEMFYFVELFCQIFCYLANGFCQCFSSIKYSCIPIFQRNVDKGSKNKTPPGFLIDGNSYVGLWSGKSRTKVSVEMSWYWIILHCEGKQWMPPPPRVLLLEKLQIWSQVTIMFLQKKIV